MRTLILVLVIIVGGFWFYANGKKISESEINKHYAVMAQAIVNMDTETQCNNMAPGFVGTMSATVQGKVYESTMDRQQTCDLIKDNKEKLTRLSERLGRQIPINYNVDVRDVSISADHKGATVKTHYTFATGPMKMNGDSIETLIKLDGKLYVTRSENATTMSVP